ncbi:exodeoxyribonuclease VII small subunit [Ruania suaedae]|uniref:exodeoxyribonuclease VII small subunit n=1 Tax=Ruania suaedae TaxID=2897774 RepID=UPI001E3169E6|nr:exodeoxyribonuclease VII small subunit [Ruania suaedae]UFU02320.1 exodeoxyribonuclease VII small subunit [Ruania suaedae]
MCPVTARNDVHDLSYEQARDELVEVVAQLESGAASLEESLDLWERGEALADRCQSWLDAAGEQIRAVSESDDDGEASETAPAGPDEPAEQDEED